MIQKIKEFIIGIITLVFIVLLPWKIVTDYRQVDKHYACAGHIGSIPKVFSLHYNRRYTGAPWTDKGYLKITLESNWYDFAALYYINDEGELDKEIMDSAIKVTGAGLTKIQNTIFAYSMKRKLTFNTVTSVLGLEDSAGINFTGTCREVK